MLKLYNTLSRKKEEFSPLNEGEVLMYSCGPTVYNYAHIGNLRTYIFMDLLRRSLRFCGFKLKGVLNITDVGHLLSDADDGEDKMALTAKEERKTPQEIAEYYAAAFFTDAKLLNIEMPETILKVTDHIHEMIAYVEVLLKNGYAYETSDGIYFDVKKFPQYGLLSRQNEDEKKHGARVLVNNEKRNPNDFALWKKAEKNHIMQWPSPWGMGFPGWHIECSALSLKYLGKRFDIHTGGVDHIPVHHENEIAQSYGYDAALRPVGGVNYWLHGEFVLVDGGKMSKSLKNTYTVSDLGERGFSPMEFRYFCLNTHYRKKLNFTFEALNGAKQAYARLLNALSQHKNANEPTDNAIIEKYLSDFADAVEDDINVPLALGVLWKMLRERASFDVYNTALKMDAVLGLSLGTLPETKKQESIPASVLTLATRRLELKREKNFAEADKIRNEIDGMGYLVLDTKDGFDLKKK